MVADWRISVLNCKTGPNRIGRQAKNAMQLIKNYLNRYVRDVIGFLLAFGAAAFGIIPMVAIIFREYSPFVYSFVGLMGLTIIGVFAAVSSVFESYRYKFFVFVIATLFLLHRFWDIISFDPSLICTGAINWNRIIFAQLLFASPIIYGFRERHRIKARWKSRASWE